MANPNPQRSKRQLRRDQVRVKSLLVRNTADILQEGITRELFALLGERAPPVAITEHVRYRERRKFPQKVQPWYVKDVILGR